ncbi:hypothetical protein D3C87_2153560 [compost metagenome]
MEEDGLRTRSAVAKREGLRVPHFQPGGDGKHLVRHNFEAVLLRRQLGIGHEVELLP